MAVVWLFVEALAGWRDVAGTATKAALYQAFGPAVALRRAQTWAVVYTPEHGSWRNVAESERSVLTRQCLGHRIATQAEVAAAGAAWKERRNTNQIGVAWHFTTEDARIKLKHLYPIVKE